MTTMMHANRRVEMQNEMQNPGLVLDVFPEGDRCVVRVSGELDLLTRNELFTASTSGNHPSMTVDLAGVTFMDCSGYGSLVATRLTVESGGRALTITGATGQPADLLERIATADRADWIAQ